VKVSIIVASYGSQEWDVLGDSRALPSAERQGAYQVIRLHEPDGTVASSRNAAAERASGDWLVFLDADDELAPGFLDAITMAGIMHPFGWTEPTGGIATDTKSSPILLTPAVAYRRGRRTEAPRIWPECDLREGNWMIIGTAVPRDLFLQVGGFVEGEPHGLEDWSLWQRCWKAGAVPVKVPDAVYVAHRNPTSKHHLLARDRRAYLTAYHEVRRRNFPDLYPDGWSIEQALTPRRLARRR
jgi:glycosyltransferase involved in cell wall biosynthesis